MSAQRCLHLDILDCNRLLPSCPNQPSRDRRVKTFMKRGASGLGGGGGRGSGGASGGGTAPVSIITISGTTPWAQAHSRRKMASAIIDLELEPLGAALDAGLHGTAHTAALNEFRRFLFMKGIAEDFDGTTIQAPAGPLLALWNMMCVRVHIVSWRGPRQQRGAPLLPCCAMLSNQPQTSHPPHMRAHAVCSFPPLLSCGARHPPDNRTRAITRAPPGCRRLTS